MTVSPPASPRRSARSWSAWWAKFPRAWSKANETACSASSARRFVAGPRCSIELGAGADDSDSGSGVSAAAIWQARLILMALAEPPQPPRPPEVARGGVDSPRDGWCPAADLEIGPKLRDWLKLIRSIDNRCASGNVVFVSQN